MSAFTFNCYSQATAPGQLKIYIVSFKCINQSWNGLIEFDGHGNEVFMNYGYRVYNPLNVGSVKPGAGFTPVYGSTENGRIQAGTANAIGGIANGNVVMVNTPVLNEHVEADDLIIFSPSVWELYNSNNNILNLYYQQLATNLNWVMGQPYLFLNAPINNNPYGGRCLKILDRYTGYRPALKYNNILKPLIDVQDNRSIGMASTSSNGVTTAFYRPAILVLDTKVAMEVYNHNKYVKENTSTHPERARSISEEVEMVFNEYPYAIETSNGSYSLKLKIEFIPDVPVTAPVLPTKWVSSAPAKTFNTNNQNLPGRNIKITNKALFLSGDWSGIQTNDLGLSPQPISFQLSNADEFIMADENGLVAAKGNYSISGNNFSGSHKQLSDGSTYSLIGTYDPNMQSISCLLYTSPSPRDS